MDLPRMLREYFHSEAARTPASRRPGREAINERVVLASILLSSSCSEDRDGLAIKEVPISAGIQRGFED